MGTILGLILLIGGITLYRTFALYEEKKEFNVLRGRVPNFLEKEAMIKVLLNGTLATEIPHKNDEYVFDTVTCDNGAKASWNDDDWKIVVNNVTVRETTCTISFKTDMIKKLKVLIGSESNVKTIDEFLASTSDMNKLVASAAGMTYVADNATLREGIKDSSNYTTAIAKMFLNSEAISEEKKNSVGLPCYLYKNGSNIFGGFTVDTNGDTSLSWGRESNDVYFIKASSKNTNVTARSNNLINTSPYHYVEMVSAHETTINGLTGLTTIGFSVNGYINDFIASNSERFAQEYHGGTTLTLNLDEYHRTSPYTTAFLKINLAHGGESPYYECHLFIRTIALY